MNPVDPMNSLAAVSFEDLLRLHPDEQKAHGIVATAAEIAQQPDTWKSTRAIIHSHADALRAFLSEAGMDGPLPQRPTVILTGAGTSDYIGQSLSLLLRTSWQTEILAIASTDLLVNMSGLVLQKKHYVVLSFSRSGDSPEGVAILEQMLLRYPLIGHLVITCNPDGRMAAIAREQPGAYCIVLDDAVNDRSLAMTSSFTNMVLAGQCIAHLWDEESYARIFDSITKAGRKMLLLGAETARRLALNSPSYVCVLGSGALTAVARESALKILEMTAGGVKTMSESILGLRHGPMSALDRQTLLICYVSSDEPRQLYEADLLREIGSKDIVAERIVVGPASDANFAGCSDQYLALAADVPDMYRPVVDVIFGQMLGFYFSLALNLKPDSPSPSGIISRVVAKFAIHG